jgi:antitoxin (DNA-binding transcriptional repressor) of toxin-antitoxin stability system
MHQAKSSLSQLVKRASNGEAIFIGSYGRAEAVLISSTKAWPKKRLGILEGKLSVPDDFDAPLPPEILAGFEGDAE